MSEGLTIQVPGNGSSTLSYTLPAGVLQFVQAVRATIDNTAGADLSPNLEISEQSGVVIQDVPQSGTIPAGESDGIASWGLRIAGEGGAAPTPTVTVYHNGV
jgi:hypothetical protein